MIRSAGRMYGNRYASCKELLYVCSDTQGSCNSINKTLQEFSMISAAQDISLGINMPKLQRKLPRNNYNQPTITITNPPALKEQIACLCDMLVIMIKICTHSRGFVCINVPTLQEQSRCNASLWPPDDCLLVRTEMGHAIIHPRCSHSCNECRSMTL